MGGLSEGLAEAIVIAGGQFPRIVPVPTDSYAGKIAAMHRLRAFLYGALALAIALTAALLWQVASLWQDRRRWRKGEVIA
jgi:hypothetical protein